MDSDKLTDDVNKGFEDTGSGSHATGIKDTSTTGDNDSRSEKPAADIKIVEAGAYGMYEENHTNSGYSNDKSTKGEIGLATEEPNQELISPFEDSDEWVKPKVSEVWSTAAIKDELTFQLSSTCSFKIDEKTQAIHITHKYYDQADFVLYRINIYKPRPVFIIKLSDITAKLQNQLEELYKSSRETFDRVVTDAVQSILESINQRYYHISNIAYKVCWRFEP